MEMTLGPCWGCTKAGKGALCPMFGTRLPFDPEGKGLRPIGPRFLLGGAFLRAREVDEDDAKDEDYSEGDDSDDAQGHVGNVVGQDRRRKVSAQRV
jgi:hypothetical protein